MKLGLRCYPDKFAFVLLDGPVRKPVEVESDVRKFPKDLNRAGFLSWISVELKNILHRHAINGAAFKEIESTAQKTIASLRRAEVEGVVQAVLYEAGCRSVDGINKKQIKTALGFGGAASDVSEVLRGSPLEKHRNKDTEDAALAAWSLLK